MKYLLFQSFMLAAVSSATASNIHRVYGVEQEESKSDIQLDIQNTIERFSGIEPVDSNEDESIWDSFNSKYVSRIGNAGKSPRRFPRIDAERVPVQRGPAGISFIGRVGLGTPPQYFRLAFDISWGDTWVAKAGANCTQPEPCSAKRRYFNSTRSSTFELWPDIDWKGEFLDKSQLGGRLHTEIVQVGGYVIDRQVIEVADVLVGLKDNGIDGILGLGLKPLSYHGDATPIENLIDIKGMKSEVGIWLGSGRLGGELVFGDSDPERFKGKISHFKLPENAVLWSVPVLSIAAVQSALPPPVPINITPATFNTTGSSINADKPAEDVLNRATESNDDDWLFGNPWFVNNYMTLDHKNRQVGIAPSVRPEESKFQ
ncbi:hypothetical protein BGZ76_010946 [Entomortierella beljakovae]|nr:hypothetical protein BGZ76_010946 [Entomortierella beljakovae]